MIYVSYGAATPVEGVDVDGVGVVLLVDLEAQVSAENIMKVWHLVSIYWQASDSQHIVQCWVYHPNG